MKLNSFEINNFRGFSQLCLPDLGRVNLIAGENNVGKTAVLEALWQFTAPNQPGIGVRLDMFRGITQVDRQELMFDLFNQYDVSRPIEFAATGDWGENRRELRIEAMPREMSRTAISTVDQDGRPEFERGRIESDHEIILKYVDETGSYESSGWYVAKPLGPAVEEGIEARQALIPGPRSSNHYFSARQRTTDVEVANMFGAMQVKGLEAPLLDALKAFEPNLRGLTVIPINGVPMVHANVQMERLIPMGLMGDGINRLLSFAVTFASAPKGFVLLDEIENGIHYSKLVDLWRAISAFSESFDVQVFATTHSMECVRAAHNAFSGHLTYDFRYHRLDRIKGDTKAETFDKELLDAALEGNLEVR